MSYLDQLISEYKQDGWIAGTQQWCKDMVEEVRVLQSRLEELNQKVDELEKENASLKPMAERYVWLRDHYHGFEHYRSGLAKKMNMFENDISKAMRSTDSQ